MQWGVGRVASRVQEGPQECSRFKGETDLTGKYFALVVVEIWWAEVQWGVGRVASRVQEGPRVVQDL